MEKEREDALNEIINKLNEPVKIIDDLKDPKDMFDNVVGYENVSVTDSLKKGVKKKKLSKLAIAFPSEVFSMKTYVTFVNQKITIKIDQYEQNQYFHPLLKVALKTFKRVHLMCI